MIEATDMQGFVKAYVEAIYFTECGPDGPFDSSMLLAPEAWAEVFNDCNKFVQENEAALEDATGRHGYGWAQAGHDFWLTRNGHGAGFWDRTPLKMSDLGEFLTEKAKEWGQVDVYSSSEDNMLHFM